MDRSSAPRGRNASFPRRRKGALQRKRKSPLHARFESLEARQMLDASFVVSELMALNTKTVRDEDLAFSDWIEIRNDGDMAGDLGGHYLTNSLGDLTQWQFPAGQTLDPGEHLVVFASGKDRANVAEPHTNFTLDHTGGDVALVAANGTTIVSQLAGYPSLVSDQSYGLIRRSADAEWIGDAAPSRIHVPADNSLGTSWTGGSEPFDDSAGAGWTAGTGTIGYDTANGASSFLVQVWYSTVTVTNLAQSDAAIAGQNVTAASPFVATPQIVNYLDTAGDGNYAGGVPFPGGTAGDDNNFVMRATTTFFIRPDQAGIWTFGFNSDDGGRLRIDGANVIVDDTNHAPADFLGSVNLTAGLHTLEYVYWEQGGGAEAELFASPGLKAAWDGSFSLIGDPNGVLPLGSLDDLIDTDIEAAMHATNATAFVRYPFTVTSAADVQSMQIDAQFDDGYAAYLNGTLVATSNAPGTLTFDSAAVANLGLQSGSVDLTSHVNLLQDGQNILAIHGLNAAASDEEFFLEIDLTARELGTAVLETIDLPTPGAANGILEPVITEFQASNRGTIDDEDGESSDWVEIHNPGSVDVNLGGWYLTDDPLLPMKWQFPATRLAAEDYLLVFASGKDRAVFGEELHTNFALNADGEYLALIRPDGTPAWEYEPGGQPFTPQFEDVSYGLKGSAITGPDDENIVGLVAYWDFEDGPGSTTLTDSSGNGWNGTLTNMDPASDWIVGRIGARALDFDGANDAVITSATTDDLDIAGRSKRTISGWIRGAPLFGGRNGSVFEVGTGGGEFALRGDGSFGTTWRVEQGDASMTFVQSSANAWFHVAVVYDGVDTIVYVDGAERGRSANEDLDTGGDGTFNLGIRTATNLFFRGGIDDLAVWDMALSPSVISSLANETMTPLDVPTVNRNIGTTQIGFSVRHVNASASFPGIVTGEIGGDAGGGANPLADADTLLGLPGGHAGISGDFTFNYNQINFRDPDGGGSSGNLTGDESFPLDEEQVDEDHFAVRATATLVVPAASAGEFTFGVHADEGARLRIDGADIVLDNAIDGANLSTGTVTLTAGDHTLELVHFERTGGAEVELLYKSRSGGSDDAGFEVLTVVKSQQLPPPPVTIFDAEKVFFTTPTPGAANNVGVDVFVGPTSFSVPHGFYSTPQSVDIVNTTPGVQIYYTLDGTDPFTRHAVTGAITPTGTLWNGSPLDISSTTVIRAAGLFPNAEPSKVATASYIFTADVVTQQPTGATPPGWPSCSPNSAQYGMDPAVVNDPVWGAQMEAALTQVATMSIVMDLDDFCGPQGIHNNAGNRGRAWERPISLEMIAPAGYVDPVDPTADHSAGFQVNAGLRIRGGFSRSNGNPKHAFRLFFRGEYGDSKLNFPLFGNEGTDSFDSFDLRTSQNYSWAFQNDSRNTMLRDELSRVLEGDLDQAYTRGRYYHLYINGIYWGIFNSEERPEADFAESYFGGVEEDYDVVKNDPRQVGVTDGNTEAYMRLFDAFSQPGGLSDANLDEYFEAQGMNPDGTRNSAFERLLDVENLQDHLILTYYTAASDSAGSKFTRPNLNNWFAIYNRENPDGFQHMAHDFEHSFDTNTHSPNGNMVEPFVNNCGSFTTFNPHCQHEILMETNSVYAQKFVDRVNEVFFNDGPLATENAVARLDGLASQIDLAMIAEAARWGNSTSQSPDAWATAYQTMRDWITTSRSGSGGIGRVHEVIDQLRAVGWYPQVGAPTISPNGGQIDDTTEITLTLPGTVIVDVDDTVIVSGNNGATNANYIVPTDASVDGTWMQTGFDDSTWATGALGIGYERGTGYGALISTSVDALFTGTETSVYMRVPFSMASTDVEELVLRMKYDDGYVAYLNGVEVARRGFSGTPAYNSLSSLHDDGAAVEFEDVDISAFKNLLVAGPNLLAIHGMNTNLTSSDMLFQPELVSRVTTIINLEGAGQIYYTTDGSDPRGASGDPGATAVSYNTIADYITTASAGNYIVPTGAPSESGWQGRTYDDSSWNPSVGPIGFDTGAAETVGGFAFRVVDTTAGDIPTIDVATNILNGNTAGFTIGSDTTRSQPYVNHGDGGNLAAPPVLPVFGTPDREQYVIRAVADVTIPVGTYTVAVGSDDGFRLTIPGVSFTSKFNANGDPGNGTDTLVYSAPRGLGQTGGTFTVSGSSLTTTLTLDFYERGGGDVVELSLAAGAQGGFNAGLFSILQDGLHGWSVLTTGENVDYDAIVQTDVEAAMLNQGSSLYARYPFAVSNVSQMRNLSFSIAYDDGFVAYLNGVEVASRAAPASPAFDSTATAVRSDGESLVREFIDLSESITHLVNGQNVLAIHLLNASASNPDALVSVELDATFGGQPFTLTDNALLKTRAFLNGEWSPLSQAQFILGETTLAVTEINYNPAEPTPAEISAGFTNANEFEFIELINTGARNVNLAGVAFIDGITFDFNSSPVQVLSPGERVVIVGNLAAFTLRYGGSLPGGTKIAGTYSGNLSNGGENLTLVDGLGGVIQSFSYNDTWYGNTDGVGFTLNIRDTQADPTTWGQRSSWRPSSALLGTPGAADTFAGVLAPGSLLANELLAAAIDPADKRIELLNPTAQPIDISGWYMSDDPDVVTKYQLPSLPPIAPGEFRVLDEQGLWDSAFSLANIGGNLILHATDGGTTLVGFAIYRDYGAAEDGVVHGRHINSDGDTDFTALVSSTFGGPNAAPIVGPIVINEVHYHPQNDMGVPPVGGDEYVELVNISASPVSLNGWQFANGVNYTFGNVTLAPGEILVLAGVAPATFAANPDNAAIPGGVVVEGPFSGSLDNDGENVELYRPGPAGSLILADRVDYNDAAPWPILADGTGPSLSKIASSSYGNDPASWTNGPDDGTPGSANGSTIPGDVNGDGVVNAVDIDTLHSAINAGSANPIFDLDGSSTVDSDDATFLVESILGTRFGDINLDGAVNRTDASILAINYGYSGTPAWAKGDFDGDGLAGVSDLAMAQANMGFIAPPSPAASSSPSAPAAVIAAANGGATRVATRRASAAVRVVVPAANGVDQVLASATHERSGDAQSRTTAAGGGLRIRAARYRAALSQAGVNDVDLSAIASEVRRIRRS